MSPENDKFERTPTYSSIFQEEGEGGQTALAGLSSGQREQLARETETLSQEHSRFTHTHTLSLYTVPLCVCRFEVEVTSWSDSGHDIIIIAKEMCSMMMDMSNFTKYARERVCVRERERESLYVCTEGRAS